MAMDECACAGLEGGACMGGTPEGAWADAPARVQGARCAGCMRSNARGGVAGTHNNASYHASLPFVPPAYSFRKLSTGFASAALIDCQLMVAIAINKATSPESKKIPTLMSMR